MPAPIWPNPARLLAIPVLMTGKIPVSTTLRASIPVEIPWKSQVGIGKFGLAVVVISVMSLLIRRASSKPPVHTKRGTAGAAIIAKPPTPKVSVIALSPMSGEASSSEKPEK